MKITQSVRDRWALASWSARQASRRAANRWWDLAGRAAGFCMETTWQPDRATYGKAMRHWRCGKLRREHAVGDPWHRAGDYRWRTGGQPVFDRNEVPRIDRFGEPTRVGVGDLPRWLRGRHYPVGTRRRDRLALRSAFERIEGAARATKEESRSVHPAESSFAPFATTKDAPDPMFPEGEVER